MFKTFWNWYMDNAYPRRGWRFSSTMLVATVVISVTASLSDSKTSTGQRKGRMIGMSEIS